MTAFDLKTFQALQKASQKKYKNQASLLCGLEEIPAVEVVPINDPILDKLLAGNADYGGIIRGGIIEISGGFSSGKTTLALEWLAQFMNTIAPDRGVAFIDVEKAMDSAYARHLGVDVDSERFVYSRPEDGQEAVTLVRDLMRTGMFSCIVLDSWAALEAPRQADAETIGNHGVGDLARLSGDALRAIKGAAASNDTTFIILNQERVNMTAMGARGKKTTGGNAMTFFPDMRLSVNKKKKDGDERIVQVIKSKCQAMPWTSASIWIKHNLGLDRMESLISMAIIHKMIVTGGAGWMTLSFIEEDKKVQGRERLADYLITHDAERDLLCDLLNVDPFKPRRPLVRCRLGQDPDTEETTDE